MSEFLVAALYKFVSLDDHRKLKPRIQHVCADNHIYGTLILAAEGINGTVAGPPEGINKLLEFLRADTRLADLTHKESSGDHAGVSSLDGMSNKGSPCLSSCSRSR